jgi:putative acyl-CoA dehydrogenase
MMRLGGALDRAADSAEAQFRRLALAVSKYWTCKRAIPLVSEALECLGGNGYVEESIMPRLYREAPLNSIWEGSGNVNALDVLRAMGREPESVTAFIAEVEEARGSDARLDRSVVELKKELSNGVAVEAGARRIVERLALTLQGSLLVRYGDPAVADAFCATRLGGDWGHSFGTLPGLELASIVQRHRPPA